MPRTYTRKTVWARFLSHVQFNCDGHWQWTANLNRDGYGRLGRGGKHGGMMLAHRAAYELFVGPISEGLELDHLCRNRACVNPDHLELVTHKENLYRGQGFVLDETKRTHCPMGHPYDKTNTYVSRRGMRSCRACHRERERARAARLRSNPA